MKKSYVKPELFYESFELSQHIATCDYKINSGDAYSCKIEQDNYADDYTDVTGGFISTPTCDFSYEIYCYTAGSGEGPNVFMS